MGSSTHGKPVVARLLGLEPSCLTICLFILLVSQYLYIAELFESISDVCFSSIEAVEDQLTILRRDVEKLCEKRHLFADDLNKVFYYSKFNNLPRLGIT